MKRWSLLLGAVALFASVSCFGQTDLKGPAGPVALTVRLPNPNQQILFVHEVMPARPGPLTLYYPKYIPGDHAPDGPIGTMMGLEITAGGKRIAWLRDEVDMFTFHLTVPAGVDRIDIRFEFPADDRVTPHLMGLEWNTVALYQAGYPTKVQMYEPTLVIPAGWRYATALTTEEQSGGDLRHARLCLYRLWWSAESPCSHLRSRPAAPAAGPRESMSLVPAPAWGGR